MEQKGRKFLITSIMFIINEQEIYINNSNNAM